MQRDRARERMERARRQWELENADMEASQGSVGGAGQSGIPGVGNDGQTVIGAGNNGVGGGGVGGGVGNATGGNGGVTGRNSVLGTMSGANSHQQGMNHIGASGGGAGSSLGGGSIQQQGGGGGANMIEMDGIPGFPLVSRMFKSVQEAGQRAQKLPRMSRLQL